MYPTLIVPDEAAEISEQMGTKFKFWYPDPQLGLTLFKEGRPHTGENWAEKLACELAQLLDIPHAYYELARWKNKLGVVTPTIVRQGQRLIHGNELLAKITTGDHENLHYYYQRHHTANSVVGLLRAGSSTGFILPPQGYMVGDDISSALDVFIGYLMFDAWIGNQDRHSENWGILRDENSDFYLAPSYDHGSSLARTESDEKRERMLRTKDKGASIEHYVTKARSALYPANAGMTKSFTTLEAFYFSGRQRPAAAKSWQRKLTEISELKVGIIVDLMPDEQMSPMAKTFTNRLLHLNKQRILEVEF